MNNVTLPLPIVIQALFPPDDVKTVEGYQDYLRELFSASDAPQKRSGRKVSVTHPHYTGEQLGELYAAIKIEVGKDEDAWKNERGRPVRALNPTQPDDPSLVELDNGVFASFPLLPEIAADGSITIPMEPVPYVAG